jgi:hypothetical protein
MLGTEFFWWQFCDVATVAISHKRNYPNLAKVREERGTNSRSLLSLGDVLKPADFRKQTA